jgi:hypothetical protein
VYNKSKKSEVATRIKKARAEDARCALHARATSRSRAPR